MPIRFLPTGAIEADTIPEAIEWERRKIRAPKPRGKPRKVRPLPTSGSPWERFCNDIRANDCARMRKILTIIRGRGHVGIDLSELTRAVGETTTLHTSGTIGGISKKGEKFGLTSSDLVVRGPDKLFRPGRILQANEPPSP